MDSNESATTTPDAPLVTDLARLFRYSGLLDALRDSAKVLYKSGHPSQHTIDTMLNQYHELRNELAKVVRDDLSDEVYRWAPELKSSEVTIDGVYVAAAQLARWMDLLHQSPQFLLAQSVQEANANEVRSKLASAATEHMTTTASLDIGNYL